MAKTIWGCVLGLSVACASLLGAQVLQAAPFAPSLDHLSLLAANDKAPPPPSGQGKRPAPPHPPNQDKAWDRFAWGIFPGIYRSYNGEVSGFELTVLPSGFFGACLGFEKRGFRYLEVEWALWVISLGAGLRRSDSGGVDAQATIAFPLLPIFPYLRFNTSASERSSEYGFMIKLPLIFGGGESATKTSGEDFVYHF